MQQEKKKKEEERCGKEMDKSTDGEVLHLFVDTHTQSGKEKNGKSKMPAKTINNNNNYSSKLTRKKY
jgi:hypothetical protein